MEKIVTKIFGMLLPIFEVAGALIGMAAVVAFYIVLVLAAIWVISFVVTFAVPVFIVVSLITGLFLVVAYFEKREEDARI